MIMGNNPDNILLRPLFWQPTINIVMLSKIDNQNNFCTPGKINHDESITQENRIHEGKRSSIIIKTETAQANID